MTDDHMAHPDIPELLSCTVLVLWSVVVKPEVENGVSAHMMSHTVYEYKLSMKPRISGPEPPNPERCTYEKDLVLQYGTVRELI